MSPDYPHPIHPTDNNTDCHAPPAGNGGLNCSHENSPRKHAAGGIESNRSSEVCSTPMKNEERSAHPIVQYKFTGDAHRDTDHAVSSCNGVTVSSSVTKKEKKNLVSPSTVATDKVFAPWISPILASRSNYFYSNKTSSSSTS